MAKNSNLHNAKVAKNDDFFTQLSDIENELQHYWSHGVNHFEGKSVLMNCDNPKFSNFWVYFHKNFNKLKLTRIGAVYYSTSEPVHYKEYTGGDDFDINIGNEILLRGNGDFRSEECIEILKGYDMVVTNPPFSLWRDMLAQIIKYDKEYILIGNMNAVTCKEVFPLIKDNKIWLGTTDVRWFYQYSTNSPLYEAAHSRWFTNLDHGRRHQPLPLMTMDDNIKFSKHKEVKGIGYQKYDNYDAIEVPFTDAIPSDYDGAMGVPISFLDKYCPVQFEILGMCENEDLYKLKTKKYSSEECKNAYWSKFNKKGIYDLNASGVIILDNLYEKVYQRILIRKKQ